MMKAEDSTVDDVTSQEHAVPSARAIALTAALLVEDAASHVRDIEVVASTSIGAAAARYIEDGDSDAYAQALEHASSAVSQALKNFEKAGLSAATVLKSIPGESASP